MTHTDLVESRTVHRCPAVLAPFVDAGILTPAAVHVASTICRRTGATSDLELLAVAFAARAPGVGHTCLDVDTLVTGIAEELPRSPEGEPLDIGCLDWPAPGEWLAAVEESPLTTDAESSPLIVEGRRIYLRRQYEQEVEVAAELQRRATQAQGSAAPDKAIVGMVEQLFPDAEPEDTQVRAVMASATSRFVVIAGGPGTGKTYTVARVLAVLVDQALRAGETLRVGLAAPTGKAAARLDEGIREALDSMAVSGEVADAIRELERGQTIHRLLGRRTSSRFWHDRDRPLPHDVVIVDETSMASLSLMASLLRALRPDARLILVGDPDQLASVEAGSVLGDIVGADPGGSVVTLTRPHRFGTDSGIGSLAAAVRNGDADAAVELLRSHEALDWVDAAELDADDLRSVESLLVDRGRRLHDAARAGDVAAARSALDELVVLCAHRRGRDGVAGWNDRVDRWLTSAVPGWRYRDDWQPGRTLLATANDAPLRVFNGDLGVVIDTPEGTRVAFPGGEGVGGLVSPTRLSDVEPVHALTIHKSQGSQWKQVVVVLPAGGSRILSRQLLYTAITRASDRLTIIGSEEVVRAAVARPVRRASGLVGRFEPVTAP